MKDIPAFPQHGFDNIAERFTSQGGMTLRDYFAAKAMQAMAQKYSHEDDVSRNAYKIADAMIKARELWNIKTTPRTLKSMDLIKTTRSALLIASLSFLLA